MNDELITPRFLDFGSSIQIDNSIEDLIEFLVQGFVLRASSTELTDYLETEKQSVLGG